MAKNTYKFWILTFECIARKMLYCPKSKNIDGIYIEISTTAGEKVLVLIMENHILTSFRINTTHITATIPRVHKQQFGLSENFISLKIGFLAFIYSFLYNINHMNYDIYKQIHKHS